MRQVSCQEILESFLLACTQDVLFSYFSSTLDAVILDAKARGAFNDGIITLDSSMTLVCEEVVHTDPASGETS